MPPLRTTYKSDNRRGSVQVVHESKGIEIIKSIVSKFDPELTLELGTSWGGLTMVLRDAAPKAELYSYDRKTKSRTPTGLLKRHKNVHVIFCDLLKKPYKPLVEMCKDKRKKVLYCDNGNKTTEAIWYGSYLRVGDMIGVHDWPYEVSFDFRTLNQIHRKITKPEETKQFKDLITNNFEPVGEKRFEKSNCSTRMWIRRK